MTISTPATCTPAGNTTTTVCRGCQHDFPSRNALFRHLRETSGACLSLQDQQDFSHHLQQKQQQQQQKTTRLLPCLPLPLFVHYENDHLAVISKPAGISVSGWEPGSRQRTLDMALPYNLTRSSQHDALPQPRPVHRLDKPTQGLVLIAKTQSAQVSLSRAFQHRTIHKRYQAIVVGCPKLKPVGQYTTMIHGKAACTDYQVLSTVPSLQSGQLSLLNLYPHTGRKHQLRIHLAHAGCPIHGDGEYGTKGQTVLHKGLFLAAVGLRMTFSNHLQTNNTANMDATSLIHSKDELDIQLETPHKFTALLQREERRYKKYHSMNDGQQREAAGAVQGQDGKATNAAR